MRVDCDYLVIGTGIAGLTFARQVAGRGRVILVTKGAVAESASHYAQGGVASVLDTEDSFASHVADTVRVGRGLCHRDIVELCVGEGPAQIAELQRIGAKFSTRTDIPTSLDLGREGGHSARRIVHAADATGKEMVRAMVEGLTSLPDVELWEHNMAIDLIIRTTSAGPRCYGAYILDTNEHIVRTVVASSTIIAAGGAGKVYLYTSNPDVATGDGIAMGYRAGAQVANMEFFQFHPTLLYHPQAKGSLISEALRGEGGTLRNLTGRPFMLDYHPDGDLAPRDVVARAIDNEMKKSGDDHVYLDVSHLQADFVTSRFPTIRETCNQFGIDITTQPIPVVPAAHYCCGGLVTDHDARTSIPGLFAIGEAACTGLHGANRLASNSLLECLVFASRAATAVGDRMTPPRDIPDWDVGDAIPSDESVVVSQDWDEVRRYMWNYVGIVRSDRRLLRAHRRQEMMSKEIAEYYWKYHITSDLLELRNIATIASLIIQSALRRKESRGLHYNEDYPAEDPEQMHDTLLARRVSDRAGIL